MFFIPLSCHTVTPRSMRQSLFRPCGCDMQKRLKNFCAGKSTTKKPAVCSLFVGKKGIFGNYLLPFKTKNIHLYSLKNEKDVY